MEAPACGGQLRVYNCAMNTASLYAETSLAWLFNALCARHLCINRSGYPIQLHTLTISAAIGAPRPH
jgi:hypothetical protein